MIFDGSYNAFYHASMMLHATLFLLLGFRETLAFAVRGSGLQQKSHHDVFWNSSNPIFRDSVAQDHAPTIQARLKQCINFHCPVYNPESRFAPEYSIIYRVSKQGYDLCEVDADAQAVGQCNAPFRDVIITMRLNFFSPTPMGLEFREGETYYFISTSTGGPLGLGKRHGGLCENRNLRLKVEVLPAASRTQTSTHNHPQHPTSSATTSHPQSHFAMEASTDSLSTMPTTNTSNISSNQIFNDNDNSGNNDAISSSVQDVRYEVVLQQQQQDTNNGDKPCSDEGEFVIENSLGSSSSSSSESAIASSSSNEAQQQRHNSDNQQQKLLSRDEPAFYPRPWSVLWRRQQLKQQQRESSSQRPVLYIIEEEYAQSALVNSGNRTSLFTFTVTIIFCSLFVAPLLRL